jgi:hypothetical protein
MNETPTELQWLVLCDRIRALAQLRYCVYDLYLEGGFLFIEAKSCDNELVKHTFTVDTEGEFL